MRGLAGFIILVELFVLFGLTVASPGGLQWAAAVLPAVLGDLTNEQRVTNHLAVLTENPTLDKVATLKAEDMAAKSYFSHTSPEGLTPWHWFDKVGYDYEYAGENLAIDFTDSHDVTNAWMNSPMHRANIVKSAFTEIGTGVATGTFEGVATVFVAQVYAKPTSKTVTPIIKVTVAESTKKIEKTSVAATNTPVEPAVLGTTSPTIEEVTPVVQPTFWQKIALSPRHASNIFFAVVALGVLIALCMHIFVKKDAKHVDLVLNGLFLIIIVILACIVNWVLSNHTQISYQSFDSSGAITQPK
ncbi:MAG: hypothetical protein RLZZ67_603 [Candidatus Parcubacteria bacterium]